MCSEMNEHGCIFLCAGAWVEKLRVQTKQSGVVIVESAKSVKQIDAEQRACFETVLVGCKKYCGKYYPSLNLYLHFPAILFQSNLISNPKRMKANITNPESMDSWLEYTPLAGLAWPRSPGLISGRCSRTLTGRWRWRCCPRCAPRAGSPPPGTGHLNSELNFNQEKTQGGALFVIMNFRMDFRFKL